MDYRTPGLPVLHHFLEFAQVHAHWISDAMQPFHSPSPSSPSALHLSQHQDLFQWASSSHQVQRIGVLASASVLPISIHSGLISFRIDWFYWISTLISQWWENILFHNEIQLGQSDRHRASMWTMPMIREYTRGLCLSDSMLSLPASPQSSAWQRCSQ